jgi:hypothetical protein
LLADSSSGDGTSNGITNVDGTSSKRKFNQLLPYHEFSPLAKAFASCQKYVVTTSIQIQR